MKTDTLYIDGSWVESESDDTLDVIDPSTEELKGKVPAARAGDVDRAVDAACRAFRDWSSRPLEERLDLLRRVHRGFTAASDEIADATTTEMGAPITLSKETMTKGSADFLAATIELAASYRYEEREDHSLIVHEAYGVTGAITPWNNPIYMMLMKVAPALAAGCTVVHKPAEGSSLSCFVVAGLLQEAGLPRGVYNLVTGRGEVVGDALDGHQKLDLVSFTGSTKAGRRVMELAARTPKRVVLELGGKSASLVLDDADLESAIKETLKSAFNNAGQMCGAWTRVVVPRWRVKLAIELAVSGVAKLIVGDPRDPKTTLGPIANASQRKTILDYIRKGITQGAKVAIGGVDPPRGLTRGYYVQPTVLHDVSNDMVVAQEEIFGPVLCIIAHDGDDDAVRIANDSIYGLRGAVFSSDPARAEKVARRIRAGQVDINGYKMSVSAPFGGYKLSGFGRCQGKQGYEEYLQTKAIQL